VDAIQNQLSVLDRRIDGLERNEKLSGAGAISGAVLAMAGFGLLLSAGLGMIGQSHPGPADMRLCRLMGAVLLPSGILIGMVACVCGTPHERLVTAQGERTALMQRLLAAPAQAQPVVQP
jgi:hypothetical protein